MKHYIRNLIILSIVLMIVSTIVILIMGRTYNVIFDLNEHGYKDFIIENSDGEVEVLSKEETSDKLIINVKSKKPGKVSMYIDYDGFQTGTILYIHKSMIITDNTYFGAARGSRIIPISLSIILMYNLLILINKYRTYTKENLYQYKNITYLGLIIFLSIFTISTLLTIINYKGLFETVTKTIGSISLVSTIMFPLALITFVLVTISNIQLLIKEGVSIRNVLGLLLGIFICFSTWLPDLTYRFLMNSQIVDIYNLNGPGPYIYNFIETLVHLSVSYLECILIGTIIIAIKAVRKKVEYNKDYIIILGCGINKDGSLPPLLKGRADRAIKFRNEQLENTKKDIIFIPSGGKGNDECIAEGEAISNYLISQGINKKNIIVEDKSTNTYENIKYSNKLIKKKNANIAFSTTNYHVLRAGLIATSQGLKLEGLGSKTKSYFWINAFIREFIGTLYSEKKKHIIVLGLIIIFILLMILITYLSYNI